MQRHLVILVPLVALAACVDDLPSPSEVEDMRVLAIRADPPELLYDAPVDQTVTFEALVVDPRGGSIRSAWQFCPVESDDSCLDYEAIRGRADARHQAALDAAKDQTLSADVQPTKSTSGAVPDYDVPAFTADVSAALVLYHLESSALGYGIGSWPTAVLELEREGESLRSQKRLVLNLRDLRSFAQMLEQELGIIVCPESGAQPEGCLPIRARTPNRNPELIGVEIARGERADGTFEPLDGRLSVQVGESVRIRPLLAPDAEEPFQRIVSDLQESTISVEDTEESVSVSWFCSAGELGDDRTWPQYTKTLDTTYEAPSEPGSATIWMVARDGRGGVGWQRLDVDITP
jgi:hypothetical protein